MTTNRDWLFSLPLEEQYAWMNAEHQEPNPDCSAMLYKMFTENMKHEPCSHYEPKDDVDSRDKLQADAKRYIEHAADYAYEDTLWADETFTLYDAIIELLDRQAAITEREVCAWIRGKDAEHDERIHRVAELQQQVDRLTAERDNWKANCKDWKKDCERYREKFGKCLDYADAIHALMDEGMA